MRTSRIIMLVVGSLLILIGLGLAAGAAALGVLNANQGEDRFLSVPDERYEVDGHALTLPDIDVDDGVSGEDAYGTLQVSGESAGTGGELFIGIGPRIAVERYLLDVAHSELQDVTFNPFRAYYQDLEGTAEPAPPGQQDFWAASASGSGEQSVEWNLEEGDWTVVVMNADGSRPVAADLQMGVRSDLLGPLTWTLLISSIVLLIAGIGLAVAGAAGLRRRDAAAGVGGGQGGQPGGSAGGYSGAGGYAAAGQGPGTGPPAAAGQAAGRAPQTYGQMQDAYGRQQQQGVPGAGGTGSGAAGGVTAAAGATAAGIAGAGGYRGGSRGGTAVGVRDPGLSGPRYPARLYGELDPGLSRWMWLVKWFLAIPHYVVLFFLWIAFFVATVIAGIVILFTGRYPRGLFDFNVGVIRWSWRVTFYATRVLGTDRYPPFTLETTDYPADFSVDYPRELSRWLVLVKWWLLVIPQALVVSAITESATVVYRFWGPGAGGASAGGWNQVWDDDGMFSGSRWGQQWPAVTVWEGLSLLSLLVLIAVIILLFTGRYPRQLFDLVMGLNRWTYRVLAYGALMRDEYPPFRLDQGPTDRRDEAAGLGRPVPGPGAGTG
ncbi:DUF4389 domain-containing protein [Arthrobacter jiangjiafuii]|uniref:DUF4389 domain-containing protein n=1 Tax=Arthrobacter jiangjiafuii TaxID=2817475 RepID=A0A975M2L6_9MICC|nr:DUF4389 domain-containing protein [Arthrobacter jiangjiafuii]MBP3043269.1 DUF4389 domain-containing protein [Arthrobacter jiangjiafuii]QWC08813.1 DUF4389 domain-containing protein [Arthrobacter jiangjiafuii]